MINRCRAAHHQLLAEQPPAPLVKGAQSFAVAVSNGGGNLTHAQLADELTPPY